MLSLTDTSHATKEVVIANMPNDKEMTTCLYPLEWGSTSIRRVCWSILQAETVPSMMGGRKKTKLVTDPRPRTCFGKRDQVHALGRSEAGAGLQGCGL